MFKIFQENKSISWLISQKEYIDFSPAYQRMGNVWSKDQKQLLIDSIINGFDIPKLYFHFMPKNGNNQFYNYAVIDGKQRLETVFDFLNDRFSLASNFKFINNDKEDYYHDIAGKKYSEIDCLEPSITAKFRRYEFCIVFLDTDNPDEIINNTFIRLNSGIAVNNAEKRNAIGGILSSKVKELCSYNPFFTQTININNKRYAHLDLAYKLIMSEMGYIDLSKRNVDDFIMNQKNFNIECESAYNRVKDKIQRISNCFGTKDKLLSSKNLILTFYSVMMEIPNEYMKPFLVFFEDVRSDSLINNQNELIEFTRQLQQGADKKSAIEYRRAIMKKYIKKFMDKI